MGEEGTDLFCFPGRIPFFLRGEGGRKALLYAGLKLRIFLPWAS
jgi:hypothetical protein